MPGLNLTRLESIERAAHLEVLGYEVIIDTTIGDEVFGVHATARFTCNEIGYDTFIDAVGKRVLSAVLNGTSLDVSSYDGKSIFLNSLQAENELVVEMESIYSKSGEGLQRSIDPSDNEVYLYSQCAPAFARLIFPCFDQPNLKAPLAMTVVAPAEWEVLSNNPLKTRTELPDEKIRWEFTPTHRISSYIYALIAGPYHHVHDEYIGTKKVPLGIYLRKSLAQHLDAEKIFQATKDGFAFYENVFGLAYPFDKYDQIAVVDYNWGAMENPGAVTFKEDLFIFRSKVTDRQYAWRTSVILHEMAHMWFGNMVTMEWWNDIWLNESFAEWISYLALSESTRFTNGWVSFNIDIKNWGYSQDQLSSTHPVVTAAEDVEMASTNFDGISYAKGASILKQLFAYVGRDAFIVGLQKYFEKHAWKNTTLSDLLTELEIASGIDLKEWSTTWLETAGVTTLRPILEISEGNYTSVTISQEAPSIPIDSTQLRPHRISIGLYDLINDEVVLRKSLLTNIAGGHNVISEFTGEKVADLILINDQDLAYAKIRFDQQSFQTLTTSLGQITDPLARVVCWSAAWDMLRDAELSASDFITTSISGLATEIDIDVIFIVMNQLEMAIERYAHPTHRNQLRSSLADELESMLDRAAPTSDLQLQYAKSFSTFAHSPAQSQRIKELMSGSLPGLTVDTNLRWTFVIALAQRGLISHSELDAELEGDKTLDGQLAHAQALAAFPTAEAKSNAWDALMGDDLTIAFRVAKLSGFQRASHRELLQPYADIFHTIVRSYWEEKSYEVANQFVQGAYPKFIDTPETLKLTEEWLNKNVDAPAALRRYMSEGGDALARELRAQAKDK